MSFGVAFGVPVLYLQKRKEEWGTRKGEGQTKRKFKLRGNKGLKDGERRRKRSFFGD